MDEAQNEKRISAGELLDEIRLLVKENYVAKISRREDEIVLNFKNGQSFTLTVWENKK